METIIGFPLSSITDELSHVDAKHDLCPLDSFDPWQVIGPEARAYFEDRFNDDATFKERCHDLPNWMFDAFSFDQQLKIKHSTKCMISDEKTRRKLEETAPYEPQCHIDMLMWYWGSMLASSWNDTVDAYNGIRRFDLGIPGFDVLFDHVKWHHRRGDSKFAEVFLDGVFAYHVMHKGKRVMTIGFSVSTGRRILIQQIQLASPKGNRWLFKFPANRVELIIEAFHKAFPGHQILIVDGASVAKRNIDGYLSNAREAKETASRIRRWVEAGSSIWSKEDIKKARTSERVNRDKAAQLKADVPRLAAFYADTGPYQLGEKFTSNQMTHYEVHRMAA